MDSVYFEPRDGKGLIVVDHLTKEYERMPQPALSDVTFTLFDREMTILMGHNGAGKTTLMSIMTGILSPTGGTVYIDGVDIREDIREARKRISYCPQFDAIFDNLTVKEHFHLYGGLRNLSKEEVNQSIEKMKDAFGFEPHMEKRAKELSGGWKRRLCVAISFSLDSHIIILDEPTSGMDPEARRGIWDALLSLRGEYLILLTTHYMEGEFVKHHPSWITCILASYC